MNRRIHLVFAALATSVSSLLPAQGPDPDLLPADTSFVAHVELGHLAKLLDVEAMLGEMAGAEADQVLAVLDRLQQEWDFDPFRDLLSVTLFDRELPEDAPQIMFTVSSRAAGLIDALRDNDGLTPARRGGRGFERLRAAGVAELFGMPGMDADDDDSAVLYIHELDDGRFAILGGESARDLQDAASVLAGERPSLRRGGDGGLTLRPSQQCLVYVEIAAPLEDWARRSPASSVAKKIQQLAVEVSESRDDVVVRASVQTDSPADANAVAAVINGLRGLIELTDASEEIPEIVRETIADARASADRDRVTVELSAPLDELLGLWRREVVDRRSGHRRSRHDDNGNDGLDQADEDERVHRRERSERRRVVR